MIKILSFLLLSSLYLYGESYWTLSGLTKINTYVKSEVDTLNYKTVKKFKPKMLEMLKSEKIKTEQQDSPILMLTLQSIENEGSYYVYVNLALGEDIQTFRDDKTPAFAITYNTFDFIEVDEDELDSEVLESVDFLISQFAERLRDDKE